MKPTALLYGSLHTVIKLFAIAFTCVYLHLSVGVVKTTHYCMGRESSFSLYSFQTNKCGCSFFLSNLEKNSCCHDESQFLVLDDDQTPSFSISLSSPEFYFIANLNVSRVLVSNYGNSAAHTVLTFTDIPPPKEPLYKVFCSYTLYEEEAVV